MKRAVLTDKGGAVNADDVVVGKDLLQLPASQFVVGRLAIGRIEYGTIDDEEVRVCCRKPMTFRL